MARIKLIYVLLFNIAVTSTVCSGLDIKSDDVEAVLRDIIKRLDERDTMYQTMIQQQQAAMVEQQRISALEREVVQQRQEIDELKKKSLVESDEDVVDVDSDTNDSDSVDRTSITHMTEPKYSILRTKQHNRIRQVENENSVAFLATLSDHVHELGADQNVAFNNVITNIGDGYHPAVGAFIAPVAGIYVFSTTLLSYHENRASYAFQHNGRTVVNIYHGPDLVTYETAAHTIVLQLAKGDDISVASRNADTSLNGIHYSSLSGFLLQQIYDATTVAG